VASARQIRQLLAGLNKQGTTIFLTTHYIEEAERLCGRIAFIVQGKVVRTESVANLLEPVREKHVMLLAVSNSGPEMQEKLALAFPRLAFQSILDGQIRVESEAPIGVSPLARFLEDMGVEVAEARRSRPSLEDVFVRITGIETGTMKKEKEKMGGGA